MNIKHTSGQGDHRRLLRDDRFDFDHFGATECIFCLAALLLAPAAILVKFLV